MEEVFTPGHINSATPTAKVEASSLYPKSSGANFEAFGTELFEGLEYLLKSPTVHANTAINTTNNVNTFMDAPLFTDLAVIPPPTPIPDISVGNPKSEQVFDRNYSTPQGSTDLTSSIISAEDSSLSYEEENMMLKHFFKNLLPLLDAHPNSPWPDLALKYCDFDIARSCFISLACIHIYESRRGGNEYYRKGMAHISNTMDYLIQFISSSGNEQAVGTPESNKKKLISSFVILVLINVHILFAVLEKGLSSFSRFFFKVFSSVCQDTAFYNTLKENEKKHSLAVVLSWYDTVSAIVSPDCRLPYCDSKWYGSSFNGTISTAKMMGCPGEIFKAMSKVCLLRHELANGLKTDRSLILNDYELTKINILKYRDYVDFRDGEDYAIRLKAAQCWALAVLVTLTKTVKPDVRYNLTIQSLLHEFIDVYGSMTPTLPVVTQMVWPVFAMGCECKTDFERQKLCVFMDTLYLNAQMGTLFTLKKIVLQVWDTGCSSEEVIQKWVDEGIDYLPL